MAPIGIALRRTLILLVLAAGIGAALSWRRSQSTTPTPAEPPQWPEWPASAEPIAGSPESAVAGRSDAELTAASDGWIPAHDDGSAPESHPIKVKLSSGIFHVPGGRFYDRTRPDRCYPTAAAAEADGYRRSKT
jgi:hypothetical protein